MNSHQSVNKILKNNITNQIRIWQGDETITNKKIVSSEGFSLCLAAVILNLETNATLVAHVDYRFLGRLTNRLVRYLNVFNDEPGEKLGIIVQGSAGLDSEQAIASINTILTNSFSFLPTMTVDSGRFHWGFTYNSLAREFIFDKKNTNELVTYKFFPEYNPKQSISSEELLEDKIERLETFRKTKEKVIEGLTKAFDDVDPDQVKKIMEAKEAKAVALTCDLFNDREYQSNCFGFLILDSGGCYEYVDDKTEKNRFEIISYFKNNFLHNTDECLQTCMKIFMCIAREILAQPTIENDMLAIAKSCRDNAKELLARISPEEISAITYEKLALFDEAILKFEQKENADSSQVRLSP